MNNNNAQVCILTVEFIFGLRCQKAPQFQKFLKLARSPFPALATGNVVTLMEDSGKLSDATATAQDLFNQLNSTFHHFLSALPPPNHDPHTTPSPLPTLQHLSFLLRSCLFLLTHSNTDPNFLLKSRHLLRLLRSFFSVRFTQHQTLRFRNFLSDADLELSDSCRPFFSVLLEVFADEFLRDESLERCLMTADSASPICEKLFVCQFSGGFAGVLEVISTHFILSVSDEKGFEDFISRLFLHCDKDSKFTELSPVSSIKLLLDPVVLCAPKMFQAHIISTVSDAIGSGPSSKMSAPDIDWLLLVFEKSVILYSMHMSSLKIDGSHVELKHAYNSYVLERGQSTFDSYIRQGTNNRLNQVVSKLDNSWDSYKCKISSITKADLLADYITFMKGRQYIYVDSCRDVATSILESIIHRAFSQHASVDALYDIKENASAQDVCLLASILKLMSVSLLQAVKHLHDGGDLSCPKTMGSTSVREKYDFLIRIIDHFQQFRFCLPIQDFLYDVMKSQQSNCRVSMSMFLHFIGLLAISFSNGLDMLAKGCISVSMALLYLFVFEEGDLVAFQSLRGLSLRSCSSEIPYNKSGERTGDKQPVSRVAAEFHRIRAHNLRKNSITTCNIEDRTEETCNGELFLNCILKDPEEISELADFFECETGKNYSKWLNRREIYRKWRYKKIIGLRKIKKGTVLKSLKCQKIGKSLTRSTVGMILKHRR
ncbi:hypothetical protein RJT34_23570 [Clitoria ternatea]|uniref:DUF7812 domain-containing protein n=1 Tax=Clitoria ternatea TaxID=43366 RepID=A0AAN9FLV1_CLITE